MRLEMNEIRPANFKEYWPGQYDIFSHLEYACGIPSVLFAITTLKENGRPNVNFSGWSSFSGDGTGFYAIMPGIQRGSHTYANIRRTGEFIVNFISREYYDACLATIEGNGEDADELAAGGFTREAAQTLSCPRIGEAFLCLECTFEREVILSEDAPSSIIIGRVRHIGAHEGYAKGLDAKYEEDGFMLTIHAPKDWRTGEGKPSAVAVCNTVRVNEDG